MSRSLISFLSMMVLCCATLQAGEVYRWVDEQGNVHYSETPPAGQEAEQTGIRTGPRGDPPPQPQPPEEAAPESPEQSERPATEERAQPDPEATAEMRRHNCEQAREALETLDAYNRVRVEEDGELRYLTPEEMEEQRERFREMEEENC